MIQHLFRVAALASLSLTAPAQTSADPASALGAWRDAHGPAWTAEFDPRTGFVRSLYGGHTEASAHLVDDRAALKRARALIAVTTSLSGIDPATLVDERALFLPLSNAGSSDKYCASFRQVVRGVPVVAGSVQVLMDLEGRALSIDSSAVPAAASARTTPIRAAETAANEALRVFAILAKSQGTLSGEARLVLDQVHQGGELRAVLAWELDVFGDGANGIPRGLRLRIADQSLALTSQEELVHTCDVSGTVFTRLTPGTLPDIASNPTVQIALPHVEVQSAQGNAITDDNGNFNIVGASAPLSVSVSFDGPYTTPTNAQAAVYVLPAILNAASGNQLVMNSPAAPLYTAEANSTYWIGRLRDYVRAVNPADATADFDALSNINLAQTCNAYYSGGSVNFFAAGGGCVNTAYSTVVAHEMGHWLNVRYSSGNGGDGFGEGNADVWAMYLTDQPVVGDNFFNGGGIIRSGLNNTPFCGDPFGGCHGEVHADGEVLMGALWKVRSRLKIALGASAGAAASDLLFNSWMNAYNDSQIKTIVRTHWLVLDDDDGDVTNGSPHWQTINQGFVDQGFPSYQLAPVSLSSVTLLPNTLDEIGPYLVSVTATANIAPPLSQPELLWRVDGGSFNTLPMSALGGNHFQAAIPGQVSPAKVEYYLRASDSLGTVGVFPPGAPTSLLRFLVGEERVFYSESFDTISSTWQTGTLSGPSDWQYQIPMGQGGDPSSASTGLKCWGTDLGNNPFDGLYSANATSWIESPPIDLLACPRPRLRFQRWLGVESSLHDHARILVNGQVVWENPSAADLVDSSWTEVEYDLTAFAAGNPSVRLRFELSSDGQVEKGGWNIDDVQIVMVSAAGQGCSEPISYCVGKPTSVGTIPFLTTFGAPSAATPTLAVEIQDAAYLKPGLLLRSTTGAGASPFQGGTLCLQPPIGRYSSFLTDAFGYAHAPFPITPGMVGQTWYVQAWFRDPPASFGVGLTDALQIKFCP
ncbi:MAG TPA: hypothetical protein VK843_13080 [Planctomycetota bacterium]|nr:hypothetical protein [Planctomycetota bacterium]